MTEPQRIREHGWRQGSVLPAEFAIRVAVDRFPTWSPNARAIVLSQDCDVVHASYESEPTVELIRAESTSIENGLICHGRNPRRLQLQTADGTLLELSIHDRWCIARSQLEAGPPHASLFVDGDALVVLTEWVAKRYTRPAFPDAFNERRSSAVKKIENVLKKSGKLISGIFLLIKPDAECAADETYEVALRITATKETLALQRHELDLVRTTKQIADALDACNGLEVVDHALLSESDFSLDDLRYFRRWDWDYRSHSGQPGGEIAASR